MFGVRSPNSGSMAFVLLFSDEERRTRTWGFVAIVSVANLTGQRWCSLCFQTRLCVRHTRNVGNVPL